jgi:hypothetical protein
MRMRMPQLGSVCGKRAKRYTRMRFFGFDFKICNISLLVTVCQNIKIFCKKHFLIGPVLEDVRFFRES